MVGGNRLYLRDPDSGVNMVTHPLDTRTLLKESGDSPRIRA